eukprot:TRINITY_DN12843_c0_g1_i1.p1 TRINITY_DN12843_c0_g1~~TRINITY_DN12843_c0_g1_i1.p1  ORF type:complete len:200 (+),score=10.71 TRINITY_DN12843_c0_g1_i1:386-985(+)
MASITGSRFLQSGLPKDQYLPHPFPLQRMGRTREAHAGGFVSYHDNCRPLAHPDRPCCPERAFMSYGEWWEAHQKPPGPPPPEPDVKTFATNFWPYGRSITDVITTEDKADIYELDKRYVRNVVPHIPKRDFTNRPNYTGKLVMKRSDSVCGLMGSSYEDMMWTSLIAAQEDHVTGCSSHCFLCRVSFNHVIKVASLIS